MTPPLHNALPGILGLVAVAAMAAVVVWVRLRRAAHRTLSRYRRTPE